MDIKSKKLILLMMKLNNANHLKLKFTSLKTINLEMFYKVRIQYQLKRTYLKSTIATMYVNIIEHYRIIEHSNFIMFLKTTTDFSFRKQF